VGFAKENPLAVQIETTGRGCNLFNILIFAVFLTWFLVLATHICWKL
jgi:hypothetical protein